MSVALRIFCFFTAALAGLSGSTTQAQSEGDASPAAITQTVFVGCSACTNIACTVLGNRFCDSVSHTQVSTINVGDSVHFSGAGISAHSAAQGGFNRGDFPSICTIGSGALYSSCDTPDPGATPVFTTGAPVLGVNYTFRFDQPGTYPYYCAAHVCNGMRGTVIVNPASAACSGVACQQPLLRYKKVAAGTSVVNACGFGAPGGTPLAVAATVLCWNAQSTTTPNPGTYHVFRDTQPNFALPSVNYIELTDPTRLTCTPDYADGDPLPVGAAGFYYRICDNATCNNG